MPLDARRRGPEALASMSDAAPPTPASPAPAPSPTPAPLTPAQTSGQLFVRWNVGTLLVAAVAFAAGAVLVRAAPPARAAWDPVGLLAHARWDDGLAEVARYAARGVVDGKEQARAVVRVALRALHDPITGTRPEGTSGRAIEAIETLALHEAAAGAADARTVAVVLDRRDARRVLGATAAAAGARGVTTVRLRRTPAGLRRDACSPFEGEGTWQDRLEADVVLEDQLPLLLRAVDWAATDALEVELLPSLLSDRAPRDLRPARTRIARAGFEQVKTAAGTFDCVRLEAQVAGRTARWWLATVGEHAATRPLVRWDDGATQAELTGLEREAWGR